jgi:hypothetical protein
MIRRERVALFAPRSLFGDHERIEIDRGAFGSFHQVGIKPQRALTTSISPGGAVQAQDRDDRSGRNVIAIES